MIKLLALGIVSGAFFQYDLYSQRGDECCRGPLGLVCLVALRFYDAFFESHYSI